MNFTNLGMVGGLTLKVINNLTKSKYIHRLDQILEPVNCMIRLAMLRFYPPKTKIGISNHKIMFYPPDILQGTLRYYRGENRNDIHLLMKPIIRAIKYYRDNFPIEDTEKKINTDKENHVDLNPLAIIFNSAIYGLELLKGAYQEESSTVCHAIDLYIQLIQSTIDGVIVKTTMLEDNKLEDLNLSTNSKVHLDNIFKNIWSIEQIAIISSLLNEAINNSAEQDHYLKAILDILHLKEKKVIEIISKLDKMIS